MTLSGLNCALEIRESSGFSFRDSTIIAAALCPGCTRVYTEDLNHGQIVEGITIINPFRSQGRHVTAEVVKPIPLMAQGTRPGPRTQSTG